MKHACKNVMHSNQQLHTLHKGALLACTIDKGQEVPLSLRVVLVLFHDSFWVPIDHHCQAVPSLHRHSKDAQATTRCALHLQLLCQLHVQHFYLLE